MVVCNESPPKAIEGSWARADPRAEPMITSSRAELQGSISACLAQGLVRSHWWDGEAEVTLQAGKGSIIKGLALVGIHLSQAAFKYRAAQLMTQKEIKSVEAFLLSGDMGWMHIDLTSPQPQNL